MRLTDVRDLLICNESAKAILSRNSFGLIRLVLASVVVLHHSLVLSGHPSPSVFGGFDLGTVAVAGFFAVSGFLLLGSSRRLETRVFLKRRFFRLFPGLWACLIICAFLLVPFANYFSTYESVISILSLESSSLTFIIFNSASIVIQDSIGTVFSQNPSSDSVNGSLWTLAPEFICYLGLLMVAVLARRNLGIQFVLIMFALIASCLVWVFTFDSNLDIYSNIVNPASAVAVAFCTGSMLAIAIEYKPFRPRVFIPMTGLAIWAIVGVSGPVSIIFLSLLVVFLGMSLARPGFSQIGQNTDLSYGIYLYHFPIIQTAIATTTFAWSTHYSVALLSLLVLTMSAMFAFASWTLVEKPSILFARKQRSKQIL